MGELALDAYLLLNGQGGWHRHSGSNIHGSHRDAEVKVFSLVDPVSKAGLNVGLSTRT
jgi:hypothetical protein